MTITSLGHKFDTTPLLRSKRRGQNNKTTQAYLLDIDSYYKIAIGEVDNNYDTFFNADTGNFYDKKQAIGFL